MRSARPADDWKVCDKAGIEDLLSQIPIGDLAKKLGVDEATATAALAGSGGGGGGVDLGGLLGGLLGGGKQ